MTITLLPCPLCGGKAFLRDDGEGDFDPSTFEIVCERCNLTAMTKPDIQPGTPVSTFADEGIFLKWSHFGAMKIRIGEKVYFFSPLAVNVR